MNLDKFLRKDLHLSGFWWHRFLSVAYISLFIITLIFSINNKLGGTEIPKYKKVGMLTDRIDGEIRRIESLVDREEKIAVYEHNLYENINGVSTYDRNGGWLLKQDYYCTTNIGAKVKEISDITEVYYYKGNLKLVPLNEFVEYLENNNALCIHVLDLHSQENFGDVEKALAWGFEAEDMGIYRESIIKSIGSIAVTFFYTTLSFLALLIIYYKVFLFVVFGTRKK